MEKYYNQAIELASQFGFQAITALSILVLGGGAVKLTKSILKKTMDNRKVDPTVTNFTLSVAYIAMMAFVIIAALDSLGVQTTSFIAVIGAAGLAIGLALQGSLSNFAAGFLMVIFRPFKIGDFIEGAGVTGTVEEIKIFTTQLLTSDNRTVIVPNAKMTGDNITNWTTKGTRRVDLVIGASYQDDIDKVKEVIMDIMVKSDNVLDTPAPTVSVSELGDNSVNFAVRPWVKVEDYWGVYCDITETIKKRFDAENISFPYPQRDVHLFNQKD